MHLVPHPAQQFEELVGDLLLHTEGGEVKTCVQGSSSNGTHFEIDVMSQGPSGLCVAEVKHYRYSSPPSADLFRRALHQAQHIKRITKAKRGLLVISCRLTPELTRAAAAFTDVEVWDSDQLFIRAAAFPSLLHKFEQLFEVSAPSAILSSIEQDEENLSARLDPSPGKSLAESLLGTPPGREHSKKFEDACIASLKYLFEKDLHGWHEQDETDDGLHRRDLVCRILPSSEVWRLMLSDLGSRYVVFEFKNYSAAITQSEVLTTEKYLYTSALRRVAIVISPHGCSKSARIMIQGAMREHGKLILSLTVQEIASLLVGKDHGTDPNTYLFEKVDRFLMGLGR
jgi:hypothetical protein